MLPWLRCTAKLRKYSKLSLETPTGERKFAEGESLQAKMNRLTVRDLTRRKHLQGEKGNLQRGRGEGETTLGVIPCMNEK